MYQMPMKVPTIAADMITSMRFWVVIALVVPSKKFNDEREHGERNQNTYDQAWE